MEQESPLLLTSPGEGGGDEGPLPTADAYLVRANPGRLDCCYQPLGIGRRGHPGHHHHDERHERQNRRHVHVASSFVYLLPIPGDAGVAPTRHFLLDSSTPRLLDSSTR